MPRDPRKRKALSDHRQVRVRTYIMQESVKRPSSRMISSFHVPPHEKQVFNMMSFQCPAFIEVLNSKNHKNFYNAGRWAEVPGFAPIQTVSSTAGIYGI